jgi:hypothetical protein
MGFLNSLARSIESLDSLCLVVRDERPLLICTR